MLILCWTFWKKISNGIHRSCNIFTAYQLKAGFQFPHVHANTFSFDYSSCWLWPFISYALHFSGSRGYWAILTGHWHIFSGEVSDQDLFFIFLYIGCHVILCSWSFIYSGCKIFIFESRKCFFFSFVYCFWGRALVAQVALNLLWSQDDPKLLDARVVDTPPVYAVLALDLGLRAR